MTFLRQSIKTKQDRLGRVWKRKILHLRCDNCGKEYEYDRQNIARRKAQLSHFCCLGCRKSDSNKTIAKQIEKTCLERYGSTSPLGSKKCQEKSKETCLNKYGFSHPGSVPELIVKRQKTCLKKYGCKTVLVLPENRKKLKLEEVKEKRLETISKIDWAARAIKSHETMKHNKSYTKSKTEDAFFKKLCDKFNTENIQRHVSLNGWVIDFYVKNINTYIQFDGVYWHGLDRSIEEIAKHKSPRDVIIESTYYRDQRQNKWFKENNVKLLRVTDKDDVSKFLEKLDI